MLFDASLWTLWCFVICAIVVINFEVESTILLKGKRCDKFGSGAISTHKTCLRRNDETGDCRVVEEFGDPYSDCNSLGAHAIVQKIPYVLSPGMSGCPIDIGLNSACMRCGLCLAIANQVNQTLIDVHESLLPTVLLNDTHIQNLLKTVCDTSFKHYRLREINGKRCICGHCPGATLIMTSADGTWEDHLKNKCHEFLEEMGASRLYEYWKRWNAERSNKRNTDLETILCRDEASFFRDCKSVEIDGEIATRCPRKHKDTSQIAALFRWL